MSALRCALAALLTVGGVLPVRAEPVSYSIDPNHTHVIFETDHLGLSTQRGRFSRSSGKIVLDRAARSGTVDVSLDAAALDMGFAKWNENMRGENFFNVAEFPAVSFRSARLVFDGDTPVAAEGTVTLLGVSRPLTLTLQRVHCAPNPLNKRETCGADITGRLKRSEFGMTRNIPSVSDEVRLIIAVEAFRD
ncbi:MAG TPA: YceI family protein [Rhodocyclaceae bacterium]|nr:YceI family protein [Rhodocyclaceae bacterium]HNO87088.1 YceI family protein [Rhodocyclaceae bacterium]